MGRVNTMNGLSDVRSNTLEAAPAGLGSSLRAKARSLTRSVTGRLASMAGLTDAIPAGRVEPLEDRRLMFALTVTADDVNPQTGIGTVQAFFGYVIPVLRSQEERGTAAPTITTEAFDDETPGGAVGSGAFLLESGIQVRHNLSPAAAIQVVPVGANNIGDRDLRVDFNSANQFFSFTFFEDPDNPVNRIAASNVSFTIEAGQVGDPRGIVTDNTVVELRLNNTVLASFTGANLRALITGNAALGTGVFNFDAPADVPGFDEIRIRTTNGSNPAFLLDDVTYTVQAPNAAGGVSARIFGATATLTGPIGASAVFADLYGRDMRRTLAIGPLSGGEIPLVDVDGDGVPNFNDGIGSITLSGVDSRSAFTLLGGTIEVSETIPDNPSDSTEQEFGNFFTFTVVDNVIGLYDDFEDAGFGYAVDATEDPPVVTGLPPGPGSVIVGAPTPLVRPQNNYNPFGAPPGLGGNVVTGGFTDATQGIFVDGNENIGRVYIHGILHGSSRFSGFVDQLVVGSMVGTVSVEGDLGAAIFGTDAGQWSPDPDFGQNLGQTVFKTGGQLIVGRTLGEFSVAGRNLLDVTVVGDINSPIERPARDVYTYYEKEWVGGSDPDRDEIEVVRDILRNQPFADRQASELTRAFDQSLIFGAGFYRNGSILSSEFIGSASSGVRIKGELSGVDTINSGEDNADVFAFPVNGGQQVVVQVSGNSGRGTAPYFRIVDQQGRTIVAPKGSLEGGRFQVVETRWTPTDSGVYYLVVTDPNGNDDGNGNQSYTVAVTGMAPVTMGMYRTGASSGFTDVQAQLGNAVVVLTGDVGSIRVGSSYESSGGGEADPTEIFNNEATQDDARDFQGGTFSLPGNVFNITTGSDVGTDADNFSNFLNIQIGGDLAQFFTGLSPNVGGNPEEGDVNFLNLSVGGRIGDMQISGGIGNNHDANDDGATGDPYAPVLVLGDSVNILTGTAGGSGDIGRIRLGWHLVGDALNIQTAPGSTIGQFLVSQDVYFTDRPDDGRFGVYRGSDGVSIRTGLGSDVRFVDTPRIDLVSTRDVFFPIRAGEVLDFVDDAGSRISISISGVAPDVVNGIIGRVRVVPIDGSQGVTIAAIEADLVSADSALGGTLNITAFSTNPLGSIGVGHIIVTDGNATSNIIVSGSVEVDVWRIQQTGGDSMGQINNATPRGDFVAVDVLGVTSVDIQGDLGRTQVPAFGPQLIGPFLGLAIGQGGVGAAGGPLSIEGGELLDNDANGQIFRPINDDNFDTGNAYLDDIGGPMDGWLNGIVVRGGNVTQANVDGRVGDFILQGTGTAGILSSLRINDDNQTGPSGFDGLVGTIYARDIGTVNIGDGIARADGPLATTGIFAVDDIGTIESSRTTGLVIESNIVAANQTLTIIEEQADGTDPNNVQPVLGTGINTIRFNGAIVRDTYIAAHTLDRFWRGFQQFDAPNDSPESRGDIGTVTLNNSTFFRSTVDGVQLQTFTLTGGSFDASSIIMRRNIGTISVPGFRNSTLTGESLELAQNRVLGGGNIDNLTVSGDITDLVFDLVGNVRGSISAANIVRSTIDVDNRVAGFNVPGDIRSSRITAGEIPTIAIGSEIQSSEFFISGEVLTFSAGDRIVNSVIQVTGPDAALRSLTAPNLISGAISVSGPIGIINVSAGDLVGTVTTTTVRGTITTLSAARDLAITTNVSGTITNLTAGRNIGTQATRGVITTSSDIATITIPNGQLYSDVRTGGSFTGTVSIGGATNKPGDVKVGQGSLIAFGRIGTVTVTGDFGGDIISYSGGIAAINITNGSFLPGRTIAAYEGSIAALNITNGNLYGNIHADFNITALRVTAGVDGVFGDIGVNESLSQGASYDTRRNQLPPGVFATADIQGPIITAGQNIVNVTVSGGSVYEATFYAGRAINTIAITGDASKDGATSGSPTLFAAGDSIDLVTITGSARNSVFAAGISSLGSDGRLGGTGTKSDTVKSGEIKTVTIGTGGATDATFLAGINAGADGVYANADDRQVLGLSTITTLNIAGPVTNVTAWADSLGATVAGDARLVRGGTDIAVNNADIDSGLGTPGIAFSGTGSFVVGADTLTITVAGAGAAFFDPALNKLTIRNGNATTNVTVNTTGASLNGFDLVTNDDTSLGVVTINSALGGDSDIAVDGNVTTMVLKQVTGTGTIAIGGAVTTVTSTGFSGGFFSARSVATFTITGDFGNASPVIVGEASITLLTGGAINITGVSRGLINVARDLTSLTTTGGSGRSNYRFGGNLGSFTSGPVAGMVLSVADNLGAVTITGGMENSQIVAGGDLGSDGAFGGTGDAADINGNGSIASVAITGDFRASDIAAGVLRGVDRYFGTGDDSVAAGRSTIGPITITGNAVGTNRSSENYRIISNGTVGAVTAAGRAFTGAGNLLVQQPNAQPKTVQVSDIRVIAVGRQFQASIVFNQAIDSSTLSRALSISEVRGTGDILIRLIEGIDYTVRYDVATTTAVVTFAQSVTGRNLPVVPGQPGPGIYRFELEQGVLKAQLSGTLIDGNGDGFTPVNDDFSEDVIIGDAGDKAVAETVNAGSGPTAISVDFYAPINLDIVLDNNVTPNGLPDTNKTFTIRGSIGDHPDNDANFFRFAGDADVFTITLTAGQIVRFGAMKGSAQLANQLLISPTGVVIGRFVDDVAAVALPTQVGSGLAATFPAEYLIKQTGQYTIAITNNAAGLTAPTDLPDSDAVPGGVGDYNFTLQIFDDGDSGFTSNTDSGNGQVIVDAPPASQFAGTDGVFGTGDDATTISTSGFNFTLDRGLDGIPNTADDVVNGTNNLGTTVVRTADGAITRNVLSAIGPAGHAGVPGAFASDVDIFHLNNRSPIAAGTKMKITVKLSASGADLGSASAVTLTDERGSVQFGLFDTSSSVSVDDAVMVFSPTDFLPNGGAPNTVIADNGETRYGYDANGDFFIEFIVPERIGGTGNGTFAVYVQGVYNTDYGLEIVTNGTGTITKTTQYVLLETEGGSVDWLQTGGFTTLLEPFIPRVLGFNGSVQNGQPVDEYIIDQLVTALNSLYSSAGIDIIFSTNPGDFEFSNFSTVYLSSGVDPLVPLFDAFGGGNFGQFSEQFFSSQPYGFAEHTDPFNADNSDEAVIFAPSFGLLGLSPSQTDVDRFVQSLTGAVSRRVGELVGLRLTSPNGAAGVFDPQAADSVNNQPGVGNNYNLPNVARDLSNPFDSIERTNFFLGRQNAVSLLDRYFN